MAITATHTDWLSPELQRAAVAADSILKGEMLDDCIRHAHIILATLLNNAVRDALWDLHDQLAL